MAGSASETRTGNVALLSHSSKHEIDTKVSFDCAEIRKSGFYASLPQVSLGRQQRNNTSIQRVERCSGRSKLSKRRQRIRMNNIRLSTELRMSSLQPWIAWRFFGKGWRSAIGTISTALSALRWVKLTAVNRRVLGHWVELHSKEKWASFFVFCDVCFLFCCCCSSSNEWARLIRSSKGPSS